MFDAASLRGMVNTLTVDATGLTRTAAKEAMVSTAIAARDRVLGGTPKPSGYRQIVDSVEGAQLTEVKPDGVIVFAWQYLGEIVLELYDWMVRYAPRESGRYQELITVFADRMRVSPDAIPPDTKRVNILSTADYARRLEVGRRRSGTSFVLQVPSHNVEALANRASRRFSDLARITFEYYDLDNPYYLRLRSSIFRRRANGTLQATPRRRHGAIEDFVRYPSILIEPKQA